MAIEPRFDIDNTNGSSAAYPDGSAKDVSAQFAGDGTPLVAEWLNDVWGFLQSITEEGGIAPNGQPDSVTNPQYLDNLKQIFVQIGGAAVDSVARAAAAAAQADVDDLQLAVGNSNPQDMGPYTGAILTPNQPAKVNIQELSNEIENIIGGGTIDSVARAAAAAAQLTADNNSSAIGNSNNTDLGAMPKWLTNNTTVRALFIELDNFVEYLYNYGNMTSTYSGLALHNGGTSYSWDINHPSPPGWILTGAGTGRTLVTHNFGDTNYIPMVSMYRGADGQTEVVEGSITANTFEFRNRASSGTVGQGSALITVHRLRGLS